MKIHNIKTLLLIFGLMALTSCSMATLKNTPETYKIDSNVGKYYVESFELKLDESQITQDPEKAKLRQENQDYFQKVFAKRLSELNIKKADSIPVKIKIGINELKIKGDFARINRMLGGKDRIQASCKVLTSDNRTIKYYKSFVESGVLSREWMVYRLASSVILREIFGDLTEE